MTFATILSRSQQGLDAPLVRVEVHVGSGLPAFSIVGLPETVVKESKDRVRAALANCGFELPAGHITVNLAPADLPKEGGRFDLPIAIGILVASGQLPHRAFDAIELYGGRVETRLDASTTAVIRDLRASASLGQDELTLDSMTARFLNIAIEGSGRIPWSAFRGKRPSGKSKPLDLSGLAPAWRRAEEIAAEIQSPKPIRGISVAAGKAKAWVSSATSVGRGVVVDCSVSVGAGIVRVGAGEAVAVGEGGAWVGCEICVGWRSGPSASALAATGLPENSLKFSDDTGMSDIETKPR